MLDIELSNVEISFGFKKILDGVTLQVNSGDKIAIVGGNGAGKTTIFKLITGEEKPNSGLVIKRKNITVGHLSQFPPVIAEELTVQDFLVSAFERVTYLQKRMRFLEGEMARPDLTPEKLDSLFKSYGSAQNEFDMEHGYEVEANAQKMAMNLGIGDLLEQNYNSLSGGQKTIACLARVLLMNPNVLLLDEPTNHLDIQTLGWLEDFVKHYNGTVIVVSHDRYFLDKTISKVFAIENGKVKTYVGNYTNYITTVTSERELQEQAYVTQQKQIDKLEDTIRKNRSWGAQSSEKAYRVAKRLERRIDEMDKVERPKSPKEMALNFNKGVRSGKDVLLMEDVSFAYGDNIILCGAEVYIPYQDKICLIGDNGTGKTTVLKLVLGMLDGYSGKIKLGSSIKTAYLPQHVVFEDENLTILQEFQRHFNDSLTRAYSVLASFNFYGEEVHKRISTLSGGEKIRLKFAELIQSDINFLVLDEPTNHLDVNSRETLERALDNFNGTVLFVSHDRYFINKVATRVLELSEGELVSYIGNYDDYLHQKEEE